MKDPKMLEGLYHPESPNDSFVFWRAVYESPQSATYYLYFLLEVNFFHFHQCSQNLIL